MDIGIDVEAICKAVIDNLPDVHPVVYVRDDLIEGEKARLLEILIPETDAEFGLKISPDKTMEVMRVKDDGPSRAILDWVLRYLVGRGFTLVGEYHGND